jgi:serine/threonine protein kinase
MQYGRYRIVKELGRGSMGVVYQAHDPQIDRMVALKVLRSDRVASDTIVQRFLKEAKAVGRLSHPNIVVVYDIGEDHGTVYISMEYVEGKPLNEVLQSRKLNIEQAILLGIQVADGLDYAHRKGIVHRDIKPSNIIVQQDDRIKITDFGIAHIEDPNITHQTVAGEILGTPAYMSPEQVLGKPVDGRSDLFSLASYCTNWQPVSARFEGEAWPPFSEASPTMIPGDPWNRTFPCQRTSRRLSSKLSPKSLESAMPRARSLEKRWAFACGSTKPLHGHRLLPGWQNVGGRSSSPC